MELRHKSLNMVFGVTICVLCETHEKCYHRKSKWTVHTHNIHLERHVWEYHLDVFCCTAADFCLKKSFYTVWGSLVAWKCKTGSWLAVLTCGKNED